MVGNLLKTVTSSFMYKYRAGDVGRSFQFKFRGLPRVKSGNRQNLWSRMFS